MRLTVNNLTYYFEVQGEGPPLVLLHGFTGSVESWRDVAPALARRFQVIAIDLPGHGKTEAPVDPARYAMSPVAEDVRALIAALDAHPAHWLGYSMGGRLALYLALRYPGFVRSLILESGSPGLRTETERSARRASDGALADRIEQQGIRAFVEEWEKLPLWESQRNLPIEVRTRLREQRLRCSAHGLANSLRGMGTGMQLSLWDELPTLKAPAVFMAGALDTKFTQIAREMYALSSTSSLCIIPDAGHTPHLEQPEAFLQQVMLSVP